MRVEDIPEIDFEELKKFKEDNFKERLKFIDMHTAWMKRKSNKEWSEQHKVLIDSQV